MLGALTSRIQSPDSKDLKKNFFSHHRRFVRLLGSLQFDLFPSSLLFPPSLTPKAHHFSFPRILSQSAAGTKMEDGAWGLGELARDLRLGYAPVPSSPAQFPALTWAYPRCLLLLPILATSAQPPHLVRQTCKGPGWGQEAAAAGLLAPSRPRVPYSHQPPFPRLAAPSPPPPPSGAPIPAPLPGSLLPCRNSGMISHRSELLSCLPWNPAPLHPPTPGGHYFCSQESRGVEKACR